MIPILLLVFVLLISVAYNVRLWRELRTWANWACYGRIALSWKGKIQLQAPLTEFVAWANMLKKDEQSKGRVIWKQGPAACVIAKAAIPKESRKSIFGRKSKGEANSAAKPGTYRSKDDTQAARRAARKQGQNTADPNREPIPVSETARVNTGLVDGGS